MPVQESTLPAEGKKAPTFTLEGHKSGKVKLADLKGKWVVLYFYPKDDTPGCTVEANEFKDHNDAFIKANAIILGVSPDSVESHCKFAKKFDLNYELLADTDHGLAEKYGVWVEKMNYGKTYMGVQRATFLINPEGKIAKIWPKVKPEGHAQEVLETITKS